MDLDFKISEHSSDPGNNAPLFVAITMFFRRVINSK
jgi:hypothetical protein